MSNYETYAKYYKQWLAIWKEQSEEVITATALIRAMECTNGCVQYAFRDEDSTALDIDQTRLCMKTSMSAIKTKVLPIPGEEDLHMPEEAIPLMNEAREAYQKMKTGDEDAYDKFYALSTAHFHVIGEEKMEKAFEYFRYHFTNVFTEHFINLGEDYVWYAANY